MSATADSFLSLTRNFVSPEMIQKFSGNLGEPADKIKTGLTASIPMLLMGIVNKGTTPEGANSLINMVQSGTPPRSELSSDPQVVSGIFGGNLSGVVSKLASMTGMDSSKVTKMLSLAAPVVMGYLGNKIKRDNMNATGLMSFLSQQKPLLSGLSGIAPDGLMGNVGNLMGSKTAGNQSWLGKVLIAVLVFGGIWWFLNRNSSAPAVRESAQQQAVNMAEPSQLNTLDAFLRGGAASELPKRFRFERLHFETGTAVLQGGAEAELDQIAAAMKANPTAQARLEGYTDNTGQAASNQQLSKLRAESVKQQLVGRGVADRIMAEGLGSENPVASNDTEQGRAANRRIEFVVTQLR